MVFRKDVRVHNMYPPGLIEVTIPNRRIAGFEGDRKTLYRPESSGNFSRRTSCDTIYSRFADTFKTYCRETTLHGFKYLVRPRIPTYGKLYWALKILVVYILVAWALWKQMLYFYTTPVLITFHPKPMLISSIPLPAVTLCPDTQVRKSVFNLSEKVEGKFGNLTRNELELLYLTTIFCDITFDANNLTHDFTGLIIRDFSQEHNSYNSCKDFIVAARYNFGLIDDPCQYFQSSFSPQGACLSFNLLPPDQLFRNYDIGKYEYLGHEFNGRESIWNPEEGYKEGRKRSRPSPDGSPPWSTAETSLTSSYLFLLKVPTALFDPICFGGKGFHGYIHNPAEIPSSEHTSFYVPPGRQLNLQIKPQAFIIEEQLKTWEPASKMCFMQNERHLQHFTIYTRKNCEIECESNFTIMNCGCAQLYHPRAFNIPVCGPRVSKCLSRLIDESDGINCNCLPGCSEIDYDADYVAQERNWPEYDYTTNETLTLKNDSKTVYMSLKLSYRTKFILAINRETSNNFIDLVANVGGLLSLFTGFSILSLVEIFYFFALKSCNNEHEPPQKTSKRLQNSYMNNVLF